MSVATHPRVRRGLVAAAAAIFVAAAALVAVMMPRPASAASLTEITNFGNNPSNLQMYLYVPDNVDPEPALVVALHYCTGSGPAFHSGTEWAQLADQHGFVVLYPSVTRSSKCWDVSSPASLSGGGSDSVGVKSMMDWVDARYNVDPDQVYSTGVSSGAMMTNVMLAVYPEVFEAGAAFSGVPYTCFATTNGSEWNSECSGGTINRTPQQWGDAVRSNNAGYSGPWPRMQIWHGTNDDTLRYPNFQEQIDQWTNVHGTDQTPDLSDVPQTNWNRTRYGGTGAQAAVEAISLQGTGHNLYAWGMASRALEFFGYDTDTEPTTSPTSGPTDPTTSPTAGPAGGCSAAVKVVSSWNSGWQANVDVTAGDAAISGWRLTWTWPAGQTISSSWNATVTSSGSTVTATDVDWNGTVNAGQTKSSAWGFIGTGSAVTPTVTCTPA
ncbi:extracellular catalytic domain type 1 short-chain-length polyhydroxyalkanoate depolymerase [Glycomyces harbinensis]|uniref:Esterase, PHB depolymerase family n=1 Tax=Glycomyces harbinensis TaxID=58114 RepID=A0A1G7C2P1_9ACTN|nr:PHB depolymerase family esterase [Glycomyces harbinensis]SDE33608.1 esterase, PHB depolymerase family [Glycomyces harbinensis]